MKLKENKKMLLMSKINLALSIFLLAFAFFWMLQDIYKGKPYYVQLPFLLLSLTLLISSYMNIKRYNAESKGNTIADERSRRAVEKAGLVAFLLLLGSLMVSGLTNSILNLRLEYTSAVFVISVATLFSWILIGYYFDKKGDV